MNTKKLPIEDLSGFSARMRTLMAEQKSVNSFAKQAGVTEGAIRNYLRGGVKPSHKVLEAIAHTAHVSPQWLATGEGERTPQIGQFLFAAHEERALLKLTIQDAEEILLLLGVTLQPPAKAELILALFDYYADVQQKGRAATPENVVSFIEEKLKRLA